MPDKRDLCLDEFDISKYRYRELYNFCLQYPEWIRQRNECYLLNSSVWNGSSNFFVSDKTAQSVLKIEKISKKIELVEQTAIEIDSFLYPFILKGSTEDISYNGLRLVYNMPCSKNKYFSLRKKFFVLLHLKK